MKEIVVIPKQTTAKTQYWEIEASDEEYLYHRLQQIQSVMGELATHSRDIRDLWFKRRPDTLPRGKLGPNSYASIVGGIVAAKLAQPTRNLSEPQLPAIEEIFRMVAEWFDDIEPVEFKRRLWSFQ